LKEYEGLKSGSVSAFILDADTKDLRLINRQPTQGADPCHVCLNNDETHVFVSNFMSGSICVFPIREDGGLGQASQFIQHDGRSVNPERQAGPHAHSIAFDVKNRFAFVPDLGMDKVVVYGFDVANGTLSSGKAKNFMTTPGAGPRHLEFHPNGRFAYLINELSSEILVLRHDSETGVQQLLQTVSTVPSSFHEDNACADIYIPVYGKFVYGSNRGHDSLAVYRIDETTGFLSYVYHQKTGGKTPRNFCIDPEGQFLLVANQDSNTVISYRIDTATGKLEQVASISIPTPVCVKFAIFDQNPV
jgi:6-phosphogluconolactonase